jgi:hypothetical protein
MSFAMAALRPVSGINTPIFIGSAARALESMMPLNKAKKLTVMATFFNKSVSLLF